MPHLDEETRPRKWLKQIDARWRPQWVKADEAKQAEEMNPSDSAPKDPYADRLGVKFDRISADGTVVAHLTVATRHLNHQGVVHGGVLFTIAESVLAKAGNSHGITASTLDVAASFVAPARAGDLITAEAKEVGLRRRTAVYTVTLTNQQNETIAVFQGTAIRTS